MGDLGDFGEFREDFRVGGTGRLGDGMVARFGRAIGLINIAFFKNIGRIVCTGLAQKI